MTGEGDGQIAVGHAEWNARAASAESAVLRRYVSALPGVAWGRSAWPRVRFRPFRRADPARWHYWWSAHLIDASMDAAAHRPSPRRRRRARALARGIRLRNGGTLSRPFYDDLAWLGLAFERGRRALRRARAVERIAARMEAAIDPGVGALPWRVGSRLFNAPANGPAAILFARTGRIDAAIRLADWLDDTLRDPATGLVIDGIVAEGGEIRPVSALYSYCQGVVLGLEVELARRQAGARFAERAAALIDAVDAWTAPDGILPGAGGGDGGLFAGITCRYLADAARRLETLSLPAAAAIRTRRAAAIARALVLCNAHAVWSGRLALDGQPLFAADWRGRADGSPDAPERDLSVQVGGWLALEAAVEVTAANRV